MTSPVNQDDCSNCPACRTRTRIYGDLIGQQFPMILPIAKGIVEEMDTELIDTFGGKDAALNSMLLTAAETFQRTVSAGGSDKGLAWLAKNAEELHFNPLEIKQLTLAASALAATSGRLDHQG